MNEAIGLYLPPGTLERFFARKEPMPLNRTIYRVRRQAITGKFILQYRGENSPTPDKWFDLDAILPSIEHGFTAIDPFTLDNMHNEIARLQARVAAADKRATAQRNRRQKASA